jgi:mannose-6-phosphate isomerase-like protein (cupin superfamily)
MIRTPQEIVDKFKKDYPNKTIIQLPEDNPTEILCEIEPSTEHPEYSIAIAAIKSSSPHYHKETVETYEVIEGSLDLYVEEKLIKLNQGETYTVSIRKKHYAKGDFTIVKVTSHPGWTLKDHILDK